MLENENDELHEQLAVGDDRIDIVEQEAEELRTELSQAQESVSRQEAELRSYARELSNLKVFACIRKSRTDLIVHRRN